MQPELIVSGKGCHIPGTTTGARDENVTSFGRRQDRPAATEPFYPFAPQWFQSQSLPYPPARRQNKTVVHLQFPWCCPNEDLDPFEMRAVVTHKDTVEDFLFNFLMNKTPAHIWMAFQERYGRRFGVRVGRQSSFKTEGYQWSDPLFYFYLASNHSPNVRWSSQDCIMDLLTAQDKTLVIRLVKDKTPSLLPDAAVLVINEDRKTTAEQKIQDAEEERPPKKRRMTSSVGKNANTNPQEVILHSTNASGDAVTANNPPKGQSAPKASAQRVSSPAQTTKTKPKQQPKSSSNKVTAQWTKGIESPPIKAPMPKQQQPDSSSNKEGTTQFTKATKPRPIKSTGSSSKKDKEKMWQERFRELVEFKNKFGHCKVPARSYENKKLGRWVETQRKIGKEYPNSTMTEEHRRALDGLGFSWVAKSSKAAKGSTRTSRESREE